jgi:lactate dehydrogenase-like 2-hydroxyacid dehydrogenase
MVARGAYLINTARHEICDPDALSRALETGWLAGYASDTPLLRDTPVHIAARFRAASDALDRRQTGVPDHPLWIRAKDRASATSLGLAAFMATHPPYETTA